MTDSVIPLYNFLLKQQDKGFAVSNRHGSVDRNLYSVPDQKLPGVWSRVNIYCFSHRSVVVLVSGHVLNLTQRLCFDD